MFHAFQKQTLEHARRNLRGGEWSRSRYWLGFFLNSRHQRDPSLLRGPTSASREASRVFAAIGHRMAQDARWIVRGDAAPGEDPYYRQTLRLWLKERGYVASLWRPWRDGEPEVTQTPRWRRLLGDRFELSIQLLRLLADEALLELLDPADAEPHRARIQQWRRDVSAHQLFLAERLTMAYADFNFVRRNLRRARLRLMFLGMLLHRAWLHRELVASRPGGFRGWAVQAFRRFEAILARVAPYRRAEMLAALQWQHRRPFDRPPELS